MEVPMVDRPVRVRCPSKGGFPLGPGMTECLFCHGTSYTGHQTVTATLSDPEVEALIADGERYRALPPEIRLEYELWAEFEPEAAPPEDGRGVGG